jgi:hypothetical protein
MKVKIIALSVLYFTIHCLLISPVKAQWVTHHDPVFQPNVAQPALGVPITDPRFGSTIIRLSDARSIGLAGIIPDYSKRQAWNADQSLMMLRDNGNGNYRLYNGNTYQYIRTLSNVAGEDVFWHPTDADRILFNPDSVLYSYKISDSSVTQLRAFKQYVFANTRGEGNVSNDGRYYAFVGQNYNSLTGQVDFKDLGVYDIVTDSIISKLALPGSLNGFDWVSMSPSGNYVVVDYADDITGSFHGVEVYSRMLTPIWQKPLGAGHSDLGTDANGDDILVMDVYDPINDSLYFRKFRLSDGQETVLFLFPLFSMIIFRAATKCDMIGVS